MSWKVGDVQSTTSGVGGRHGHGFVIFEVSGPGERVLLSLTYKIRDEAAAARGLVSEALANAISVDKG